jgi:hypothetical protein
MSYEAWEYFVGVMLNNANLEYLLLCNDAKWKLQEWSKANYSSWTTNVGFQEKNVSSKKNNVKAEGKMDASALDDPGLIQMKTTNELKQNSLGSGNGEVEDHKDTTMSSDDLGDAMDGSDSVGRSTQVRNHSIVPPPLTDILRPPPQSSLRNLYPL